VEEIKEQERAYVYSRLIPSKSFYQVADNRSTISKNDTSSVAGGALNNISY
jgi:hypothetical protein